MLSGCRRQGVLQATALGTARQCGRGHLLQRCFGAVEVQFVEQQEELEKEQAAAEREEDIMNVDSIEFPSPAWREDNGFTVPTWRICRNLQHLHLRLQNLQESA